MQSTSTRPLAIAILIVGLAHAAVLYYGMKAINQTFQYKSFSSSISSSPDTRVLNLSGDKFAVVRNNGATISVYRVDEKDSLVRTSDVDTDEKQLKPAYHSR